MGARRRASCHLVFNGQDMDTLLSGYLKSVSYTDVADGSSDEIEVTLQNVSMDWLTDKYPQKGDFISGALFLFDWNGPEDRHALNFGNHVLDSIKFSGDPLEATFGGTSVPRDSSFQTRNRTKTWEKVTLEGLAGEIAGRYGLRLEYSGAAVQIEALEQSQQTDSAFLYDTAGKYGLSMKVFDDKIIIFDKGKLEAAASVATLKPELFDGGWEYIDSLDGVYTGARVSYKNPDNDEEISMYVGYKAEDAPDARTMSINETADNAEDARKKAAAEVNKSNEGLTTISGDIWPNTDICAGVCVDLEGLGRADGKYFIDQSTWTLGDSGTRQSIEAHKCQPRL